MQGFVCLVFCSCSPFLVFPFILKKKRDMSAFFSESSLWAPIHTQDQIPLVLPYPTVALIGRSNVGKSSLINGLLGGKLAKVSRTAGRTHGIFIYETYLHEQDKKQKVLLADFPGYGYATQPSKIPEDVLTAFLERHHKNLLGIWLLMDSRRGILPSDLEAKRFFHSLGLMVHPVFTKADKLSRSERQMQEPLLHEQCHKAFGLTHLMVSLLEKTHLICANRFYDMIPKIK